MKMSSQRGMALVTSLIMLGLVTLLAIAFIGVSRRERHSVEVTKTTTEAKMMADASLARAQVEVMERLRNNINFQLITSTNGVPPAAPTVDPFVPVTYTVNGTGVDRTFLDLNRNSGLSGFPEFTTTNKTGDPQWIGMLEDPTQPHGPDNRFTGRYAYMVVPASKATGLEWMNSTHHAAAMFHQLDLSAVSSASRVNWPYDHYYPSGPWAARSGLAFNDATVWLANRSRLLEPNADVFNPSTIKVGANFVGRLTNAAVADSYTFYKLAGSFSPDGGLADKCLLPVPPYITNKFNLNNTGLAPAVYFKEVADRLLKASIVTATVNAGVINYYVGTVVPGNEIGSSVNSFDPANFSSANISIYPFNQYTPEVHRLLQVAANICDTVLPPSIPWAPSVFRPRFTVKNGQVFIDDYLYESDAAFVTNTPIVNLLTSANVSSVTPGCRIGMYLPTAGYGASKALGLPIIVATTKRLAGVNPPPNLNELASQLVVTHDDLPGLPGIPTRSINEVRLRVFAESWQYSGPAMAFNVILAAECRGVGQAQGGGANLPFSWPQVLQPTSTTVNLPNPQNPTQPSIDFVLVSTTAAGQPINGSPPIRINADLINRVTYALCYQGRVLDYANVVFEHPVVNLDSVRGKRVFQGVTLQVDDPFVNAWANDFTVVAGAQPIMPPSGVPANAPLVSPVGVPWLRPSTIGAAPDVTYKPWPLQPNLEKNDRNIFAPGSWNFRPGPFTDIGQLGQIHRGTPWQTAYFKALPAAPALGGKWPGALASLYSGGRTPDTHPTNDWRLPDLFTVAPSAAAITGLPSVNNTQEAAWASVLSGVSMRTQPEDWITPGTRDYVVFDLYQHPGYNWGLNPYPNNNRYQLFRQDKLMSYTAGGCTSMVTSNSPTVFTLNFSNPAYRYYTGSPAVLASYATNFTIIGSVFTGDLITPLTQSINAQRNNAMGNGKPFALTGQVLGTPGLTVGGIAPFSWNWSSDQDDERIPLQILSRLRVEDEPIVVVYAWGQSLKPADKSIITSGVNVGLVNNYTVTGQVGTRTVLRVKNFNPAIINQPPRMVVESFKVLP